MAFDFKQFKFITAGQYATSQGVFRTFSNDANGIFSDLLQTDCTFKFVGLEQTPFSRLKRQFQYPVCCAKITVNSLEEPALLILNGSVAYAAVDRMLGGKGHLPFHAQSFSNLERAILRKLTGSLLKQLELKFHPYAKVKFSIDEISAEAAEISGVAPYCPYLSATYAVSVDNLKGDLLLAIPTPLLAELPENSIQDNPYVQCLDVDNLQFELKARLGSLSILPDEFAQLQVGDVLKLEQSVETGIDIIIENQPSLRASPGLIKEFKGVQLL